MANMKSPGPKSSQFLPCGLKKRTFQMKQQEKRCLPREERMTSLDSMVAVSQRSPTRIVICIPGLVLRAFQQIAQQLPCTLAQKY